MLYRATGPILFVLPARGNPMPVRTRRHRDTRRAQMSRLDPTIPRPYARPDPGPRPDPPRPIAAGRDGTAAAAALSRLLALGRLRRVCYWWTFPDSELIEMI